jgi:hypothetical protein
MRTVLLPFVAVLVSIFAGAAAAQGTTLYTFDALAPGDGFGLCVAGAGDVNRDGWADLIVGADMADPGARKDAGQATVLSPHAITTITGTGSPRIGAIMTLALAAPGDGSLPYQVGSSLGDGVIPIDTRLLRLMPDVLLVVSVQGWLPTIFVRYTGFLDATGKASAEIRTPNAAALAGLRIHSAFVTIKPGAPSNIESISNTFWFDITR